VTVGVGVDTGAVVFSALATGVVVAVVDDTGVGFGGAALAIGAVLVTGTGFVTGVGLVTGDGFVAGTGVVLVATGVGAGVVF
jgi:hypothetical protein